MVGKFFKGRAFTGLLEMCNPMGHSCYAKRNWKTPHPQHLWFRVMYMFTYFSQDQDLNVRSFNPRASFKKRKEQTSDMTF